MQLNTKNTDIKNADYQLVDRQGRGKAESIALREDYRLMTNAVFTSCLPQDNAWSIEAKEMRQHIQEEYAEMWHARFKVHGVPIFTPLIYSYRLGIAVVQVYYYQILGHQIVTVISMSNRFIGILHQTLMPP